MARQRKERSLRRERITIIGEGLTERWYFTHLRSIKGFKYDCKPRYFSEQSYAEMGKLIEDVLAQGGIAVCVCDADITRTDDAAKSRLQEMKEKYANNERVLICDSMPSIEFWFLVHFLNTRKYFKDSEAVIRVLKKFIPEYAKTSAFLEKIKWVTDLNAGEKLDSACNRAALIGPKDESYSEIYRAIELFKATKE